MDERKTTLSVRQTKDRTVRLSLSVELTTAEALELATYLCEAAEDEDGMPLGLRVTSTDAAEGTGPPTGRP